LAELEVDSGRLPGRALLDTGVLIRAIGKRRHDEEARACHMFVDAMIEAGRTILVAAPSYAEMLRNEPPTDLPRMRQIVVVPFDQAAARILGSVWVHSTLVHERDRTGTPIAYFKYDAMIASCAVRHRADVLVCIDHGLTSLAERAKVTVAHPKDFLSKQTSLFPVKPRG
jgi:predicted nucleic acid-binding protein